MPGPATLFTTIGAVGAAGAVAYVTKSQSYSDAQQTYSKTSETNVKLAKSYTTYSNNNKLRLRHRNDIHVLMFVVSKD